METAPPEGEDPVQWFLLTIVRVGTVSEAVEIVGFCLQRWRIEHYLRVLKSAGWNTCCSAPPTGCSRRSPSTLTSPGASWS